LQLNLILQALTCICKINKTIDIAKAIESICLQLIASVYKIQSSNINQGRKIMKSKELFESKIQTHFGDLSMYNDILVEQFFNIPESIEVSYQDDDSSKNKDENNS
jgi:hypothetical protein